MSCKSNGIIAAINVTITVIAVPTVRCHERLGIKTPPSTADIYIDLRAQIAWFNAPRARRLKLGLHALKCLPPTLNHFH